MTQKNSSKIISVVHPICCGLDVHKDMVSACIIITEPDGEEKFVVQEFSTFTDDLFKLKSSKHVPRGVLNKKSQNYFGPFKVFLRPITAFS